MYAVTGITGKVGGAMANALLADGRTVRAVLRDPKKGKSWAARGCEVAVAEMDDGAALTEAFNGAAGAFILMPPVFDPAPGFPEARAVIDAVVTALTEARPEKVVLLSTIGADATQENLLTQLSMAEVALRQLPFPLTILRPAWFLENAALDVASAQTEGVIHSLLAPLDRRIPMVATKDVGEAAAELIQEDWRGTRVVELEGPARVSPNDLAASFSRVLGKPVRAELVPRDAWEGAFRSLGMQYPAPRMRMLDGFNDGWIAFADDGVHARKGRTGPDEVIAGLIAATQ